MERNNSLLVTNCTGDCFLICVEVVSHWCTLYYLLNTLILPSLGVLRSGSVDVQGERGQRLQAEALRQTVEKVHLKDQTTRIGGLLRARAGFRK